MMIEDPQFEAYTLICDLVRQSGGRAALVGLDAIAQRVPRVSPSRNEAGPNP
jgi:hypothetical protein